MPDDIWPIVVLLGLFGWITSMLVFIFRAFPARGEFLVRPALTYGMCVFVSFAVWIVGLLKS